jgi:predicted PurR-regulated permease PerM
MQHRIIESFFFLGLLIGTLVLTALMFKPFFTMLFLAAVLAFLLNGINERLSLRLGSRNGGALVTTLGAVFVILVPLSFLLWQAVTQAAGLYAYLQILVAPDALTSLFTRIWGTVASLVPWLKVDDASIAAAAQTGVQWLLAHTGLVFAGVGRVFFDLFILLFVLFFFLRDNAAIRRRLMQLSPLSDAHEEQILHSMGRTVGATVRGKVVLAFIQGVLAMVGLWLFGVPAYALWGFAVMIASFVPTIGTALVFVPTIAYLVVTASLGSAIGLTLWAAVLVGMVDNVLGPKLMAKGTPVHPLLMFLSVLGGLTFFGPIGVLLGPVVVALLYSLFDIYLSLVRHPNEAI